MQYFGGKQRISKPLCEVLNNTLMDGQAFYDLFCGSCNVVSGIIGDRVRVANDKHPELMAMWRYVRDGGELPEHISEEEYHHIRKQGEPWLKGFVGFGCSFAGKYWGGYARGGDRNYCANAKNSTLKKIAKMQDVLFTTGEYWMMNVVHPNSMLYCDIPYKDTTGYSVGSFDHERLYAWARKMKLLGHVVLVSEYKHNVPKGWSVVWEHQSRTDIRNANGGRIDTVEVLMMP